MLHIARTNSMMGLLLLMFCKAFAQIASIVEYGVGFVLSLDYAVSSIYFSNGSAIGIVKMEGGAAYKQMMRSQNCSFFEPFTCPHDGPVDVNADCNSTWSDHLPPWLGGPTPDSVSEILSPMLEALKTATEAYTGSKLRTAEVITPFYVSNKFLGSLCSAVSDLSLRMPVLLNAPTALFGARANGLLEEYTNSFILSLDYSRAALTVMLLEIRYGILEPYRGFHNTAFGTQDWSDESWSKLKQTLHELIDIDAVQKIGIGHILLLGESGRDNRLREVLKELLLQGVVVVNHEAAGLIHNGQGEIMVDPLFAAAEGLAAHCLESLEMEEKKRSRHRLRGEL